MSTTQDQTQFKIEQLRQASLNETVQAIMMMVGALFVTVLLPSLILRYFYSDVTLYAQPKTLEYIPVISFVVGVFYLIKAWIGNMRRGNQIKKMMMETAIMDSGENFDDEEWEKELAELEDMLKEDDADKKPAKKAAAKKTTSKATAKKSTSSKKKTTKKSK